MGELTITGLTKVFETEDAAELVAVDDLDLHIEDGEFVVFVGPSGCGKTTTLRCIAGLEIPTEGVIELDDEAITDRDPSERDMAMVFQNYALYPHMTVEDNMSFGLKLAGDLSNDDIQRRVEDAAEMLEIPDLLAKHPDQLSGGQKQRVALGRAIVREPEVFLFDEPLSNLDAKLRTSMRTELQQLQSQLNITSIYVTHDQVEAMTMGDRIAVLNDGRLQQFGTPEEVYNHPTNQFVAGFIGDPSMNFVETEVVTDGGATALTFGEQSYTVSERVQRLVDGTSAVVGIRPEDVTVARIDEMDADGTTLRSAVTVVETMGDENLVYYEIGDVEFVSQVPSRFKPAEGDEIRLTFDEADLYLFDEGGEAIMTKDSLDPVPQ